MQTNIQVNANLYKVPKKAITENSEFSYFLLTQINPICCKYIFQRWQRQHCRFQFLILAFNFNFNKG